MESDVLKSIPIVDTFATNSVIVVHGVLRTLPIDWGRTLARKVPENTSILSYDAKIAVDKNVGWTAFEQQSAGLLKAIVEDYQTWAVSWARLPLKTIVYLLMENEANPRRLVFIGYALAGVIVKLV